MALFASPSGLVSLRAERLATRPSAKRRSLLALALRVMVLLGPSEILLGGAWKTRELDRVPLILAQGAVFQLLLLVFLWWSRAGSQPPRTSPVFFLYPAGWAWLWLAGLPGDDYFVLGRAVLVLVGLSALGLHILLDSGVVEARHARRRARQLAGRNHWPAETESYRTVPEVAALRKAIESDPGAALALLSHAQVPVRLGALAALEFRKTWREGQPQYL
ncbi:MAG: hypothetical protein JO112_02990, partial [Planctomycetes bacterium]|nr:hypothetical protein [Planctomycetota bacterium]